MRPPTSKIWNTGVAPIHRVHAAPSFLDILLALVASPPLFRALRLINRAIKEEG